MTPRLAGTGVWSSELRFADPAETLDAIAEVEALGYAAAWVPDGFGDEFPALERLLDATSSLTVATGILSIWNRPAADVARWWTSLDDPRSARLLVGLGVSHSLLVGETWARPVAAMGAYLDALDAGGLPRDARCLAALGPRMLAMARDRSAGAHPYLVTPEHTASAREILGDALLAVEQGVVLERDPERARSIARGTIDGYCSLENYVRSWKRIGFTEDDVTHRSDRLVDALVVWGDEDTIARRVAEHRDAGADHVCIQVLGEPGAMSPPRDAWRALAPALR